MALEEFNHFFQESFADDKDDTSGTSDFDIYNDNDPDDCYCESVIRSNSVYTNGGSIEKINDFPFDKVYFGSPNKLPTTMKLDGPLFVSPYPGIASIFSVRPQNLKKYGVPNGVRCNRDYDEWNKSLKDTLLQKPLTELHVRIQGENIKIKPTTELVSGYLYTIDVTPDIRDHIYQSSKMSKVFEFCIDKMDSVTFSDIKKINVRMTVTGENIHIQEAYDATTGEEIPIDHAYTMDEMKERTFSFKDLFSKEKRAKRYIEKRITKLLPSFMTDINKLLSAYDNDNLSRKLVMDMYYPRTVIVTHHDPATGAVYTTTEQQPTEEMIRLSCVINFFKKIIKKPHMMDMIDNPDVVYGLREELDTMLNYIYDIFKIKSTKEDLENLFGIITSISNDIDSFIGSFSSNNEVSTMFDSIDYFSDVDVEPITIQEAKLPSKKRNALDDSDFALVYTDANGKKIRKYPVHDKAHVESAARMFPRGVPLKYQGKVARKILRRAHEFGIDTSGWKNLNKFKDG